MFRKKNKEQPRRTPEYSTKQAPVFSYHASRNPRSGDSSGRYGERPVRTTPSWWHNLPTIVAVAVVLGCLSYATTLDTSPRIITANGRAPEGLLLPAEQYQEILRTQLGQSVFNRNKLTINTKRLAREIEAARPELNNVSISLPLIGRRPVVQVEAAQPALLLSNTNGSYLIDTEGRALIDVKQVTGSVRGVPVVNDESELKLEKGKLVMSAEYVEFITTISYQLQAKKMSPQSLALPKSPNELHVRLQGQGFYVKFNLKEDALSQVGAFIATYERLQEEGELPSEYVDVRVSDRVYVK